MDRASLIGVAAALGAFVTWGFLPVYLHQLGAVPPMEILVHRTLWSLAALGLFAAFTGRWRPTLAAIADRSRLGNILICALLVSINWFGFIVAVQFDHKVEASLGYYILPLMAVGLGMAVLGEKLRPLQFLAVALACLAVVILSIGLGAAPWIALFLAASFTLYGLAKRYSALGPISSVLAEVIVLAPLALIYLVIIHSTGTSMIADRPAGYFGQDWGLSLLLIGSGVITAVALVWFAEANKRLTMSTMGILQYINPTLQFFMAVMLFAEPFTRWHAIAFAMIWVAVALYVLSLLRKKKGAPSEAPS
ncbi:MAG: EamA family transporter RarD [Neomegalonema sp.]|nr:EamA family transporter RarD [Neomegalonema sp.]